MAHMIIKKTIKAPLKEVWETWDDYGNVSKFHPLLKASYIVDASPTKRGLGAERQCDMKDGNWIREEIIGYEAEKQMTIKVTKGSMPLKSMVATVAFSKAPGGTDLTMTMDFLPKFGLLGLMMVPMMKMQFRKMMGALLDANENYVRREISPQAQAA